ncbi:flagellar protein FlgN [Bacillus suaedae]|uniref:Flagellar protein FlgN n=1 Tax=Halalkalibacter suaedae TaxID=2822140 RepID=A0A940WPN6_9BACI|nr:flagellar protein FlgN [Bacillus suaedae]MBP3950041.1 flagellar protein FlgN [Bacillus suaedae]
MSLQAIVQLLERIDEIHHQLLTIAESKIEKIKSGDMPSIEALVREETKLVRKLETTEVLRSRVVQTFLQEKGEATENATISDIKNYVTETEQQQLSKLQEAIIAQAVNLKTVNDLNQSLIEESLRFVNLSLDLMVPHKEDISYSPRHRDDKPFERGRSLFDSKA